MTEKRKKIVYKNFGPLKKVFSAGYLKINLTRRTKEQNKTTPNPILSGGAKFIILVI